MVWDRNMIPYPNVFFTALKSAGAGQIQRIVLKCFTIITKRVENTPFCLCRSSCDIRVSRMNVEIDGVETGYFQCEIRI